MSTAVYQGGLMSSGFFSIPRDIYNSIKAEYSNKGYGVCVAVLNELAHRVRYNGNYCDNLKIGDCFAAREDLARAIGATTRRVRTAISVLKKLGVLATEQRPSNDPRGPIISILRTDIYKQTHRVGDRVTTEQRPQTDFYIYNSNNQPPVINSEKEAPKAAKETCSNILARLFNAVESTVPAICRDPAVIEKIRKHFETSENFKTWANELIGTDRFEKIESKASYVKASLLKEVGVRK
jgi:hypothetical protein